MLKEKPLVCVSFIPAINACFRHNRKDAGRARSGLIAGAWGEPGALLLAVGIALAAWPNATHAAVTRTRLAGSVAWSNPAVWIQGRTGTVAPNTKSRMITGSGTSFRNQIEAGDVLVLNSGTVVGVVASIEDDSHLTLQSNAATSSGGAFGREHVPDVDDDVQIGISAGNAVTLTLDQPAVTVNSLTWTTSDRSNSLTQGDATQLIVTHDVMLNQPNANSITASWKINGGVATVGGNLVLGASPNSPQGSRVAKVVLTSGVLNINGSLIFESVSTDSSAGVDVLDLSGGAATVNLAGGFNINNSVGSLLPGSLSVFQFSSSASRLIPLGVSAVTYNHVTIYNSSASGATLSAAVTPERLAGDLRVASGTLNNGGYSITLAPNRKFTLAEGAALKLSGTSAMVQCSNTSGYALDPDSTVDYAGANQTVSAISYGNLHLSGTGTKRILAGPIAVSGEIQVSGTVVAELSFQGIFPVHSLMIAEVPKAAGSWGSSSSGAAHADAHFTGTGMFQVASGPSPSVTVHSSPEPTVYGGPVALTAEVSPSNSVLMPTGWVQFRIDGVDFGPPIELTTDGRASTGSIANLNAGAHTIAAQYSGDANYCAGSNETPLVIHVSPALAAVALMDLTQVYDGTPKAVSAVTEPPGLPWTVDYGLSGGTPVDAGEYVVVATINSPNYVAAARSSLQILPSAFGRIELDGFIGTTAQLTFVMTDENSTLGRIEGLELTRDIRTGYFHYRVGLPNGTSHVSVQSDFYLRRKLPVAFDEANPNEAALDFVKKSQEGETNHQLLGGDLNHDDKVNSVDYFILRSRWRTNDPSADIDGDGAVGPSDYTILKDGWYQISDDE